MKLEVVKRFARKQSKRPILQCLAYINDEIIFTDSYVLLIEKNQVTLKDPILVNLMTGKLYEGSYPNTTKIIPKNEDLKEVENIEIDSDLHSIPGYLIDGAKFDKKRVDNAFAAFGLKFNELHIKSKLKIKDLLLIYEDVVKGIYILILGIRTD